MIELATLKNASLTTRSSSAALVSECEGYDRRFAACAKFDHENIFWRVIQNGNCNQDRSTRSFSDKLENAVMIIWFGKKYIFCRQRFKLPKTNKPFWMPITTLVFNDYLEDEIYHFRNKHKIAFEVGIVILMLFIGGRS